MEDPKAVAIVFIFWLSVYLHLETALELVLVFSFCIECWMTITPNREYFGMECNYINVNFYLSINLKSYVFINSCINVTPVKVCIVITELF